MYSLLKHLTATLAGLALLGAASSAVQAQGLRIIPTTGTRPNPNTWVAPYTTLNQYAYNIRTLGRAYSQVPPYAMGYNPYPNPIITPNNSYSCYGYCPGGYGYYGNNYVPYGDPYGGYLSGSANLVNAQSQFLTSYSQANLQNEQLQQSKIDTKRKAFDERMYERANTPTLEDERERTRREELRRAMNDPPLTEILSGYSLNTLLKSAQELQGKGVRGPSVTLDQDLLKQVNVNGGEGGNAGLLKDGGRLSWPLTLQGKDYSDRRKRVDKLFQDAVREAMNGKQPDAGTLRALRSETDAMIGDLTKHSNDMEPDDYISSKRFLREVQEGIRTLQQPGASKYVTQQWVAKGKDVGELVQYMSQNGLRFASATGGESSAYLMLHHALATYDTALTQLVASK